jgi:hypothetical protein
MSYLLSKITQSLGLSYPDEYLQRIQFLKGMAEREINSVVEHILTSPQEIVNRCDKIFLTDAIKEAIQEGRNSIEVAAPLLTFPKATPEQWNGLIDHVDTITGTYFLYEGDALPIHYGDHLLKKFPGGPKIVTALNKALGSQYHVTMNIDAYKTPASRFVITLPKSLTT